MPVVRLRDPAQRHLAQRRVGHNPDFYDWMKGKFVWTLAMLGIVGLVTAIAYFTGRSEGKGAKRGRGMPLRRVTAVEEDRETVSRVFARSPYFKVVEDDTVVEVVENPYVGAVPAGPPAARLVAGYNPDVVVAGSIGGIARRELEDRGIRIEIR